MAKQKEQARPLSAVRWDLVASMEAATNAAMMLTQAVDTAIELGGMNDKVKALLQERKAAFDAAFFGGDSA
jgi:hypothetical protein